MRSGTQHTRCIHRAAVALTAAVTAAAFAAGAHALVHGPPAPAAFSDEPAESVAFTPPAEAAEPAETAQAEATPEAAEADAPPERDEAESTAAPAIPAAEQRPLGGERPRAATPGAGAGALGDTIAGNWIGRTILALAIVIGLAVLLRGVLRRAARAGGGLIGQIGPGGKAPSGLLMVLGRYPAGRGQTLVLLKLDRRVLLTCQTSDGFRTLTEVTDPDDVASILIKSRDEEGDSIAQRFNQILHDVERDPSISGDGSLTIPAASPTTPRAAFTLRNDDEQPDESADPVGALRRRLASLPELRA